MAFLTAVELAQFGFKSVGSNVLISNKASFYGCNNIDIGNNTRIDDFCVISAGVGGIKIGSNIHIAVYTSLIGAGKITISDFCNLSSKVSIYSSNDDYSGSFLTNPMIPEQYTNVDKSDVLLSKHVIIGCGSVILPGVTLEEGVAVGALSLVNRDCDMFSVYKGNPIKKIKDRKRDLLIKEQEYLSSIEDL